jgi:hypothetical protein
MPSTTGSDDRSHDKEDEHTAKREDQLTTAPKSTEDDATPRIEVSETDSGLTRIDIREDAGARPGKPDTERKDPNQSDGGAA